MVALWTYHRGLILSVLSSVNCIVQNISSKSSSSLSIRRALGLFSTSKRGLSSKAIVCQGRSQNLLGSVISKNLRPSFLCAPSTYQSGYLIARHFSSQKNNDDDNNGEDKSKNKKKKELKKEVDNSKCIFQN